MLPAQQPNGADMRIVPLLILFVCGLSVSMAPQRSAAIDVPVAAAAADEGVAQAQYQALRAEADLALDMLRQARERRLAGAQFAAN